MPNPFLINPARLDPGMPIPGVHILAARARRHSNVCNYVVFHVMCRAECAPRGFDVTRYAAACVIYVHPGDLVYHVLPIKLVSIT